MKIKKFNQINLNESSDYERDNQNDRFLFEEDKNVIYDSKTNKDICNVFNEDNVYFLLDLLNSIDKIGKLSNIWEIKDIDKMEDNLMEINKIMSEISNKI